MDYKYIEQLLERYWQCETSVEDESELRAFFYTEEVPAHLLRYRDLFVYQQRQQEMGLGTDFDARILARIETPVVKAKRLTPMRRLMPLFKATAAIALFLSLGNMAQQFIFANDPLDYNYDSYTDTYDDPEMAYKQVSSALQILSDGINKSQERLETDSLRIGADEMITE